MTIALRQRPLARVVAGIVRANNGAWFDPSDLSTLYQDAAGTIPVTAVEQPVGLMLDKSGNGYHATQSITASRPTLSARYNLLTKTEDFSDAAWTKLAAGTATAPVVTNNYGVAPDGSITADRLQLALNGGTTTTDRSCLLQQPALISGAAYASTFWVKSNTAQSYVVQQRLGLSAQNITIDQKWRAYTYSQTVASDNTHWLALRGAQGTSDAADILIWHPQLIIGATTGPYQRVNTATDYDTDERYFPKYLRFDGIDDYLNLPYMGLYAGGSASVVMGASIPAIPSDAYVLTEANTGYPDTRYGLVRVSAATHSISSIVRTDGGSTLASTLGLVVPSGVSVVTSIVDTGTSIRYGCGQEALNIPYNRTGTVSLNTTTVGAGVSTATIGILKTNIYSLIITKSALTDAQRIKCERYAASKSGVQL